MKEFKPTYLYIKQCNVTGLKYFGKTIAKDPVKYKGSGKHWVRHIKKYHNNVTTLWYRLFTDKDELVAYATKFSEENNIVESSEWANLKIEDGLWGGGVKGIKLGPMSEQHRQRIRESVIKTIRESTRLPKEKIKKDKTLKTKTKKRAGGWTWDVENKNKLSSSRKGRTPWNKGKSVGSYIDNRITCTNCQGSFAPYTYNRWHGTKCKNAAFRDSGSESDYPRQQPPTPR